MESIEEPEWFYENFDPDDFEMLPIQTRWNPPSYIAVSMSMRPSSEKAVKHLMLPRLMEFRLDAFARNSPSTQLNERYWQVIDNLRTTAPSWADFLYKNFERFRSAAENRSKLFEAPFRFVEKCEFESVRFKEIIQFQPDLIDVYVAQDWDTSGKRVSVLRMHSSLWNFSPNQRYVWFEKRVPWIFHDEDILVWFRALINRLPKKARPLDLWAWLGRLVHFHPEFVVQIPESDTPWEKKPRIALIFGTLDQIGLSTILHIERSDIHCFIRTGTEIEIRATIPKLFSEGEEEWRFRIFTSSSACAKALEEQFSEGRYMYFGLGESVTGIIGQTENHVRCVGVSNEIIKSYCGREGSFLGSFCDSRLKLRTYHYFPNDRSREGFSYFLD